MKVISKMVFDMARDCLLIITLDIRDYFCKEDSTG